ncbi:MAG: pilus assembly protein N-terminal domain-containing protein [Holosporaceae bacterium]|jgi:pilus assembly protein CpaC|nr:pilus assembly protein N-terminal domain-containing protein [Holosporaceae bacterium]
MKRRSIYLGFAALGLLVTCVQAGEKKSTPPSQGQAKAQAQAKGSSGAAGASGDVDAKIKAKEPLKNNIILPGVVHGSYRELEVNSVNFITLKEPINEVFIPDPTVIDVQILNESSLYLMGLIPGETTLVINGKGGKTLVDCKIRVTYPLKTIKDAILEMYPDANIELSPLGSSVVIKGRVPSPEVASDVMELVGKFVDAAKIVNRMIIETSTQVLLKVKIAEVTRELTKSLGINWRALSSGSDAGGVHYGFVAGNSSTFVGGEAVTAGEISKELLKQGGLLSADVKGGRWIMHVGGKSGLSGLLDALANESFASILAEPTLVALSGKTATFKSGGEQGYTVTQQGTNNNTTEFKEWGTSIEFTPVVLSEDRINITVAPKVSTLTFSGDKGAPPALTTKEASTTVELASGQSLAIAGLLQKSQNTSAVETPFLADLPLLGPLFRQSTIVELEKELVIIVTAYIVKPSSKVLKTPVEGVPRLYSPLENLITRKFHKNVKSGGRAGKHYSAGLLVRS